MLSPFPPAMTERPKLRNTYTKYYNLQPNGNRSWPELRNLDLSLSFGKSSHLRLAAVSEADKETRMQGVRLFPKQLAYPPRRDICEMKAKSR